MYSIYVCTYKRLGNTSTKTKNDTIRYENNKYAEKHTQLK